MASKKFKLTDELEVTVYKRRLSRSLRLSLAANGEVRVSVPSWSTFKSGERFANSKLPWILEQRQQPTVLQQGQQIGKTHQLLFRVSVSALKTTTRIKDNKIVVTHPIALSTTASEVQTIAQRAAVRALRQESIRLLLPRLENLAHRHGFTYTDVTIKQLTSRWGSCDQNRHIALNLFLVQLPWELIDYVLIHELVHTRHLNHGADFWDSFETELPGAKKLRSHIRKHKPVIMSASTL